MPYQIKLPITKDSEYGFLHLKTINDTIFQNLKMLLLTNPGEKINDPDYGCGLRRYLFENDSPLFKQQLEDIIREKSKKYLPYVSFGEFIFEKKDNLLYLSIKYKVGSNEFENILTLPLTNSNT